MRVMMMAALILCGAASGATAQTATPSGVAMFRDFCLPFAMTQFEREDIVPAVRALGFTTPALTSAEEGSVRVNAYRLDWRVYTSSWGQDCYAFFPASEAPAVRQAIEDVLASAAEESWSRKAISDGIEWSYSDPQYFGIIRLVGGAEPHVKVTIGERE